MNEHYRHKASGVTALLAGRELSSSDAPAVYLHLLSDPEKATDREAVPFQVDVTSTLQPCCILQGSTGVYNDGRCPVHGEPFYLVQTSARPLRLLEPQLAEEWEPVQ